MPKVNQYIRSIQVVDPRVRKLVEDLETMLERIQNPMKRDELAQKFSGYLTAQQIEEIIYAQLQLIAPIDPNDPNIQDSLTNLDFNEDLVIKKYSIINWDLIGKSGSNQPCLNLPRSIVFLNDINGNLISGAFTLSKNEFDAKLPLESRIIKRGAIKSRKDYVLVSKVSDTIITMVRLRVGLGSAIQNDRDFVAELNDLACAWRIKYRELEAELHYIQMFNNPLISRPRLGVPFQKYKGGATLDWLINVNDERGYSLYDFIRALRNNIMLAQLTVVEQAIYKEELKKNITPTLLRKLIFDMLNACKLLHDKDFIYRDFKPDNMLVNRNSDGQLYLKIIDFGCVSNLAFSRAYINRLALLLGMSAPPPDLWVWNVPAVREEINLIYKIPAYAEFFNNQTMNHEQMPFKAREIMKVFIYDYANTNCLDHNGINKLCNEDNYFVALQCRLTLIHNMFYPNIPLQMQNLYEDPYSTFEYASPEIIKFNLEFGMAKCSAYYNAKVTNYLLDDDHIPVGLNDYNSYPEKISKHLKPEKSHDIYALGVCIFELCYQHLPGVNSEQHTDYELIKQNPLLKCMLDPDATKRCTIDQAINIWKDLQTQLNTLVITPKGTQVTTVPNTPAMKQQRVLEQVSTEHSKTPVIKKPRFNY